MRFVGHRGIDTNTGGIIENTIDAFQSCLDSLLNSGLEGGIELDLQQTNDDEIVIFHDSELNRLTNTIGNICDYDLEELQSITLNNSNSKIPTLQEFFNWLDNYVRVHACGRLGPFHLDIIFDIKNNNKTSIVIKLNDLLRQYTFNDTNDDTRIRFFLGVWDRDWIYIVNKIGWSHGPITLITDDVRLLNNDVLSKTDCVSIDWCQLKKHPFAFLKLALWKWKHKRIIAVWTINSKRSIGFMRMCGIDIAIVNDIKMLHDSLTPR